MVTLRPTPDPDDAAGGLRPCARRTRPSGGPVALMLSLAVVLAGCATSTPTQTAEPKAAAVEAARPGALPSEAAKNKAAPDKADKPKVAAVRPGEAGETPRPAAKPAKQRPRGEKPPFRYDSLNVRNSCFVESVNFYDAYLRQYDGDVRWAQVLQWGNAEGDFKIGQGHAVTVYAAKGKLWFYDINFGVVPMALAVERRTDLTDVSPRVFASYPQFRPVLARYREDYRQTPPQKRPEFLFYHKNADVRDATRVASELGRSRPTAVVEFELKEKSKLTPSAAAVFVFGRRVCVYFPRGGTHVSPAFRGSVDDLRYIEYVVKRLYPGSRNIRWQPGGYLVFPPKQS